MANPYVNKVEVNGQAIIDLTGDTVTAEALAKGVKAHNSAGAPIVGTMETGGGVATDIPNFSYTGDWDETTMGTDGYRVIRLLSSGDLTFETDALLDVHLVGGGGAGGRNMGGGGGGGYCVTRRSLAIQAGEMIPVVIGAGGNGATAPVSYIAASGGATSLTIHGEAISAAGGAGGKSGNGSNNGYRTGGDGGSGGGGASYGTGNYKGGGGGGRGSNGNKGAYSSGNSAKAGSGGAGQGALTVINTNPYFSPDGPSYSNAQAYAFGDPSILIHSTAYTWFTRNPWYGGGGGGTGSTGGGGAGGRYTESDGTISGGGGDGATASGVGEDGEANTGGGGGGSQDTSSGASGGSGIVLLRFARVNDPIEYGEY